MIHLNENVRLQHGKKVLLNWTRVFGIVILTFRVRSAPGCF